MDRFAKRSMEMRRKNGKNSHNFCRMPIDSASQRNFVTVRQIFSDGPARKGHAPVPASAVIPFPTGGCMALPEGTDEHRASIKSAIQFSPFYHGEWAMSMAFSEFDGLNMGIALFERETVKIAGPDFFFPGKMQD